MYYINNKLSLTITIIDIFSYVTAYLFKANSNEIS